MDVAGGEDDGKMESDKKEKLVFMWGYLPGASPQRSPFLSPSAIRLPATDGGDSWKDVCGGGCGFATSISESGKLITWGSTDDQGQSYVTSGKHEETPEPFPLPAEASIVKAAAGWAHCVAVTVHGEVYTWGWKECVPSGKVIGNPVVAGNLEKDPAEKQSGCSLEKDPAEKQSGSFSEQVSPRSQISRSSSAVASSRDSGGGGEVAKRRRLSSAKQAPEGSTSSDETLSAIPSLVTLSPDVKIASVAAGGRHTLALSDVGQVWGWGYGGEGQLGLGSRIRMVSTPHLIPCVDVSSHYKNGPSATPRGSTGPEGQIQKAPGKYVKAIACGGRHSAVITDAGVVLTFGWGLYGQCGQGGTDDELSPACVLSLCGIKMKGISAGLWHTVCISDDGDVYSFGGNQFGQLGTGVHQAETLPRLLDAPSLESKQAKTVSCGARHSAILTDDGKLLCWGWNKYGQLGLGDVIDRNIPCEVALENHMPTNIACGWWHTLALADPPT